MKRFVLLLLALTALTCAALADEDWELHESVLDYSILYPAELMDVYGIPEEEVGWNTDMFMPKDPNAGAWMTMQQITDPEWPDWAADGYRRLEVDEPGVDIYVSMEMMYRAYLSADGGTYAEEVRLQSPTDDLEYVFTVFFPADDPDGWRDIFAFMLETVEFPRLGSREGSFTLRYDFTGGLFFTDVVIDPEAEPIWLYPDAGVTGLVLEKLTWDDETFTVLGAEPVFSAQNFTGSECLRIYCYGEDVFPVLRVRCMNAEGEEECWYIADSGMDGSLMLLGEMEVVY